MPKAESEPVEEFITNLYVLAENCNYGILKEEMIRDRLVVGVKNFNLSEKLQLESKLTLETTIQIVRQSESVKNQQKEIRQDTENRNVDAIDKKGGRNATFFQKTRMKSTKRTILIFQRIIKDGLLMRNVNVSDVDITKDIRKNNVLLRMLFATSAERKVCHTKTIQEVSSSQNNAFIGIVGKQDNAEDSANKISNRYRSRGFGYARKIYLQHFGYLKMEKADKNLFAVSKNIEVNVMFQAFFWNQNGRNAKRASTSLKGYLLDWENRYSNEIKLKEGAKPYSIYTPRRVPIPLMKELQMELERMTSNGVIEKVEGSSEWCSSMVLNMCRSLDTQSKYSKGNTSVVEHTLAQLLAQLKGAKLFTKLNANSGFWQIPLSSELSALTTFITPFGRFRFKRLPFGISSAPEIFQKRMGQILEGLEGTLCHMDDILVYDFFSKLGLTLNKDKCKFAVTTIKFLGHQIDPNGIQFPKPRSVKELKQFLGLVNFSARFVPNLAEISHPLNKLLSKKEEWIWEDDQGRAFAQIKKRLTSAQGLAFISRRFIFWARRSNMANQRWTETSHRNASRTLSETEKRYAQIEKVALAITWACEKFKQYIQGLAITLETDHHKLLVPIFTFKNIDDLTPRIQRLRLRNMRYSYKIVHMPGKNLIVADALSRSPRMKVGTQELEEELCVYVQQVVSFMPISDVELRKSKKVIQNIIKYTQEGWPERTNVSMSESQYWQAKDNFSVENGILLKGSRYIIPDNIRKGLLQRIHEGHLGIVKCRERAKGSVWWPLITSKIEEMVQTCPMCIEERTNRHQPLLLSELPSCPWEKVGLDLFTIKGQNYLYPEIARLEDMTSASVIVHCKSIFARHRIPLESNGFIESFVKIVKERIGKSKDTYLALLAYRATPLANGFSPSELSMGRRIRTTIPTPMKQHQPPNLENLKNQEANKNATLIEQKEYENCLHWM
ncbi:K02A2.6-like [Cordylochernes scorpioides]|uniref:RNA-directed DNA polymerase n=1 Tax=Cordylochernes scorpioides TaxID=51811 RepID=A0ABY6LCV4_9ARAC|nr:K02A2.6-like [Cordylochernes scorpioides]